MKNAEGEVVGASKLIQDISNRKQIEAQRRELLAREQALRSQAEKAGRIKDDFLATVSHELRTPLSAILGWATLLSKRTLDESVAIRGVDAIERNAKAQARLIEDLLDVSRIISGKMRLEVKPIRWIGSKYQGKSVVPRQIEGSAKRQRINCRHCTTVARTA